MRSMSSFFDLKTALRLSWFGVILAALVVSYGAYTRLVDAGLGCPDWPGCYGFLVVPQTDAHIAIAESRFPDTPVEAHKGWAEMVHRYLAGGLGLLVLALAAVAVKQRKRGDYPVALSMSLLVLIIVQALFGMWTVTLKLWPQIVTLHLLGGFATLSLLFVLLLKLKSLNQRDATQQTVTASVLQQTESPLPIRLLWLALAFVVVQIALGGWTSANYAAFACPDFPTCQGELWPESMSIKEGLNITQHVGPNYLGGQMEGPARVAIHSLHRLGALIVTLVIGLLCWQLWRRQHQIMATTVAAVLCLQLTIGIANVFWQFPLALALAHNTGAALLLLTLCALICHHYFRSNRFAHHSATITHKRGSSYEAQSLSY